MLNIVLHEPEMPANTGNIGRTCVAAGARLHLIEPLGFSINDKMVKRAGLDYWDKLDVTVYNDYEDFLKKNPDVKREDIPTDLLTASGSGLDPQISPASAAIQVPRMAQASGLSEEAIQTIIDEHTSGKLFGVFGEETVNVVEVNIAIGMAMGLIKAEA